MGDMLECIEQLQNMRLRPNDIIIVRFDDRYSCENTDIAYQELKRVISKNGYNNDVIFIAKSMDIEILRKEDISDGEH